MRVCDYIFDYLNKNCNLQRVYGVVAGGCSGLNDGIVCNKNIEFIPLHGELDCAYAATGDSKLTNELSCVVLGTGVCNVNALSAALTCWQDSTSVLFIAGDCNLSQILEGTKARSGGVQGNAPVELYFPITKLAVTITNKNDVPYFLQKAVYLSLNGRKGGCFLNIPTDLQCQEFNPYECKNFEPTIKNNPVFLGEKFSRLFQNSKRPVFLVGNGAKNDADLVKKCSEDFFIPIVSTYGAQDFIRSDNFISTVGTKAARSANFVLHQSDLVIVLGSSLNVSVTGYNFSLFAPNAKVVVIDLDQDQHLSKNSININLFINSTVQNFLNNFYLAYENYKGNFKKWLGFAIKVKEKYPIISIDHSTFNKENINYYWFLKALYNNFKDDTCLVFDGGGSFYGTCQSFYPQKQQRIIGDTCNAPMYYSVSASIGASFARNKGEIITVIGDGSFSGAFHELSVIKHHNLPIKIFVINNNGYNSLKKTQENFYGGRYLAINPQHGLPLPQISKVATLFDIPYFKIQNNNDLYHLETIMKLDSPALVEVICPEDMTIQPTIGSKIVDGKIQSMPLWNMSPFLPEQEINDLLEEVKNL